MSKPIFFPKFERLHPTSEWVCEAMSDTSLLTLDEAASFASKQAGASVSVGTILRAAADGRIRMVAIVRRKAKVTRYDGGVYCTSDKEPDNTVPANSIPTLPLSACRHIANTGSARWRTFDGFEWHGDTLMRYDEGMLIDGEPDFETILDDCRVKQYDVHALADALRKAALEPQAAPAPANQPGASESLASRKQGEPWSPVHRAELLAAFRKLEGKRPDEAGKRGKHGALASLVRQTGIDKDTLALQIDRAIEEKRSADSFAQLLAAKG